MVTNIFWIKTPSRGSLGIMPRPRGGDWLEDEILHFKENQVYGIVSLLTPLEIVELQLSNEPHLSNKYSISFFSTPIKDRSVPERITDIKMIVSTLTQLLNENKNIAIHCRQGIGRSSLLAAAILVSLGLSANEAFKRIEYARKREVPDTKEQRKWVSTFAEFL